MCSCSRRAVGGLFLALSMVAGKPWLELHKLTANRSTSSRRLLPGQGSPLNWSYPSHLSLAVDCDSESVASLNLVLPR